MKKWLLTMVLVVLLAIPPMALSESYLVFTTEPAVYGLMLMDDNGEVISSVSAKKETATAIYWTLRIRNSGAAYATFYEQDSHGNWMKTDLTYELSFFFPDGETSAPAPTAGVAAAAWPEMEYESITVSVYPLPEDKRYQSRCGPSRTYHGAGAYKSYKIESIQALFIEGDYVLADLSYTTVGNRRVYFQTSIFHSLKRVPSVSLEGYPAYTLETLTPRFGPGMKYDSFDQAQIGQGTPLQVFFEENGWVFAEFDCSELGIVRAWIPVEQVQ